jgi:SAM-dependent methyltransferase
MLGKVLRDLIRPGKFHPAPESGRRRVLNVGGGNKAIPIPRHYNGWEHLLLDIDGQMHPDIVCDARNLASLPAGQFDAVYCSHNLEHYYPHDGASVLKGFLHVLKVDGFVEIRVPDIQAVMRHVVQSGMDIGDVLYESALGPITVRDVVYGYGKEIEQSGKDFYAHKTGFTAKSLHRALESAGFAAIFVLEAPEAFEAKAYAFKSEPTAEQRRLLDLAPAADR